MILNIVLALFVITAVLFDVKECRIPNWLILLGIVTAIGLNFNREGYSGCWLSLKGLFEGMLLLIIPFYLRGIGAGDVKLLGMVGSFEGSAFVFNSFIWMALFGGILALLLMIKHHQLRGFLSLWVNQLLPAMRISGKSSNQFIPNGLNLSFPYGIAIGLGVAATFIRSWY